MAVKLTNILVIFSMVYTVSVAADGSSKRDILNEIEERSDEISRDFSALEATLLGIFKIKYEGTGQSGTAFDITEYLRDAYYGVGNDLGFFPKETIEVIIYKPKQYRNLCPLLWWSGGMHHDGRIHLKVKDANNPQVLKKLIYHEYTHALLYQMIKQPIPKWFNEGLAEYEEASSNNKLARKSSRISDVIPRRSEHISLTVLEKGFRPKGCLDIIRMYSQSRKAISYLVERYGKSKLQDLLQELSMGNDFESVFFSTYHLSLSQFDEAIGSN